MKQRSGVCATLVLTGVLAFPEIVPAQSEAEATNALTPLTLSVQIYNWAKVSPATLQKGQALAGQIFKKAGLELKWVECPCEPSVESTAALSVRIIPKLFGSTRSKFRNDHLGFAAVTDEGGVLATVFYDRIESLGRGGDLSNLLGLATAHELGHLLLGSKAHTDEGIMRRHWTRRELRQGQQNPFLFSSEQAGRIRTKVSARRIFDGSRYQVKIPEKD
jgi:hypothetical protein